MTALRTLKTIGGRMAWSWCSERSSFEYLHWKEISVATRKPVYAVLSTSYLCSPQPEGNKK